MKYSKLRNINYKHRIQNQKKIADIDLHNWFKTPYSSFKAIFYIEFSTLIVFFLQFTRITPNFVTFVYIFLAFLGAALLSSNNQYFIFLGTLVFFSRGVFDWSDGLLARIKNKTSNLGHLLDIWGGIIGYFSFIIGLSLYLFNKYQDLVFIYVAILILFLKVIDLKDLYLKLAESSLEKIKKKNINFFFKNNKLFKIKNFITSIFDDRSRSVDLICLLIYLELNSLNLSLVKYILYLILAKHLILFTGGVFIMINKKK